MSPPWIESRPHPDCSTDCLSELRLDQLLHEELGQTDADEARAMIASCEGCQARWAQRQEGLSAFPALDTNAMISKIHTGLAEVATENAEPSGVEEGWLRWLFGAKWIGAAAIAALAFVFVFPSNETTLTPNEDVLRTKGSPSVVVFRERAGVVDALPDGAQAQEGDRIQFEFRGLPGGYVSIRGKEANGSIYSLMSSKAITSSQEGGVLIKRAFELDANLGQETLYIYHCRSRINEALELSGGPIEGCTVFTRTLKKVAR